MWYLRRETGFGKAFTLPASMLAEAHQDGADSTKNPPAIPTADAQD
jgi:hypothetical protein